MKTLVSWSSGKDSAWMLHKLRDSQDVDVVGIFSTVNEAAERVAMHGVRVELLKLQAQRLGLPLHIIDIPYPCSNKDYEAKMGRFIATAQQDAVSGFAFGDLFLEDVRQYRVDQLSNTAIRPVFPLWQIPTDRLAHEMIENGLRAVVTCVDPKQLPQEFAGRFFDHDFLTDLPPNVDPCGENGEFHSFVFDGPMFESAIDITVGETVQRDGFVFADVQKVEEKINKE